MPAVACAVQVCNSSGGGKGAAAETAGAGSNDWLIVQCVRLIAALHGCALDVLGL